MKKRIGYTKEKRESDKKFWARIERNLWIFYPDEMLLGTMAKLTMDAGYKKHGKKLLEMYLKRMDDAICSTDDISWRVNKMRELLDRMSLEDPKVGEKQEVEQAKIGRSKNAS